MSISIVGSNGGHYCQGAISSVINFVITSGVCRISQVKNDGGVDLDNDEHLPA